MMREIRFRVEMEMGEAVDRVAHLKEGLTPWNVLGVTPASDREEILDAYDRACAAAEVIMGRVDEDSSEYISAEECLRDYTAILKVLASD